MYSFIFLSVKNTANLTSLAKVADGHMSPGNTLIKERKGVTRRKPCKSHFHSKELCNTYVCTDEPYVYGFL